MKTLIIIWLPLLLICSSSCRKEKKSTKYPAPVWEVAADGQYAASMTAIVKLPDNLQPSAGTGDKYAAFVKSECRSIGTVVTAGNVSLVYFLIQGAATEQDKVSFRYYNAKQSYLFYTEAMFSFVADGNYGTVDDPVVLDLKQIK